MEYLVLSGTAEEVERELQALRGEGNVVVTELSGSKEACVAKVEIEAWR